MLQKYDSEYSHMSSILHSMTGRTEKQKYNGVTPYLYFLWKFVWSYKHIYLLENAILYLHCKFAFRNFMESTNIFFSQS